MPRKAVHARIPIFPYAASFQDARLDNLYEESKGRRHDLILEYQELSPNKQDVFEREGKIFVYLEGSRIPRRLRFKGVEGLQITGAYRELGSVGSDHPARELRDMLCWMPSGGSRAFYLLFNGSPDEKDGLQFYAGDVVAEDQLVPGIPFDLVRDWQSPPPFRPGLIPAPKGLYLRFGGDPVTIQMDSSSFHRRLFIGSLDTQFDKRPEVTSVLNLGEQPNRWAIDKDLPEGDRWDNKGEGVEGMTIDEIRREAEWVIERLSEGRVLVHCVGGMNRSSTICCAVLILLEGLSAEAALARVREHHPWARPDSNHWLKLLWLARTNQTTQLEYKS